MIIRSCGIVFLKRVWFGLGGQWRHRLSFRHELDWGMAWMVAFGTIQSMYNSIISITMWFCLQPKRCYIRKKQSQRPILHPCPTLSFCLQRYMHTLSSWDLNFGWNGTPYNCYDAADFDPSNFNSQATTSINEGWRTLENRILPTYTFQLTEI